MNTMPPSSSATVHHGMRIACHLLQGKRFYCLFSGLMGLLLYTVTAGAAQAAIVTTLPPLAGLVSMLDTKAEVYCLLPPGADAHNFQLAPKEALNKSGSMRLQWKMGEFKARIASHSTAMAQIFNAEIVHFTCGIANHDLFSTSLNRCSKSNTQVCYSGPAVMTVIGRA